MDLRPNRVLQHSEKNYKIYLKQLLKEQHVLYKYSMRYQQAVRRKDHTVASNTLRDLEQLIERIQKMHHINENDNDNYNKHSTPASSIHYTHILNDPFITQNHITIEDDIDDPILYDHDISSKVEVLSSTTNDQNRYQQPSKERKFIERFYQQLLQDLSSSYTKQQQQQQQQHRSLSNIITCNENEQPDEETKSESNKRVTHGSENYKTISQSNENISSTETHWDTLNTTKITHETTYAVTRELLRDMTKGTQHIDQFDNYYALLGYTRHKFIERAMLVVSSLNQILQIPPFSSTTRRCQSHQRIIDEISVKQWKQRILSIRTMTSIGCGPGCDAVGVVAVLLSATATASSSSSSSSSSLHSHYIDNTVNGNVHDKAETKDVVASKNFVLDRIVLLDWAMEQWYHPIVQCVSNMLSSSTSISPHQQQYVKSIICESCDVRQSVDKQRSIRTNFFTTQPMKHQILDHNVEEVRQGGNDDDDNEWLSNTDLVVISYLLSETRNSWYAYMDDYIRRHCKVGTLFLITDPTAWQLHIFRQRYEYDKSEHNHNHDAKNNDIASDNNGPHLNSIDDGITNTPLPTHDVAEESHYQQQRRVLMEFQWLDSSMYRQELQELEGRNGPGVLLAMKVAN